jgi:Sugar phosphate isomerases/epimerases
MKLSFSTLGCPGWTFDEIFATAKDLGYDGIEIRVVENDFLKYDLNKISDDIFENIKNKLKNAGLEIPILTTDIALGIGDANEIMPEAIRYIDLAGKLEIKNVRFMSTFSPDPKDCDLVQAAAIYTGLCNYAKEKNISPLIETNGVLANSEEMKKFMVDIDCDNAGVLWDIHHPFRYYEETPEATVNNLGELIKHVHVKDSIVKDKKIFYRMMGYGDIPVLDALKELNKIDYNGFVSLEWVKRWQPDLEEGGIVFSHFKSYMNYLARQL